jgi:hypothetical protein
MVAASLASVVCFTLAASGIPRLHAGFDGGIGPRALPYLGVFGALAVPILSDEDDLVANKVDGWFGIGVLAVIAAVLLLAAVSLATVAGHIASEGSQRSRRILPLVGRSVLPVLACVALGLYFRR